MYHVTIVAAGGAPLLRDVEDRLCMYRVLNYAVEKLDVDIRSHVFMKTHLHFLVWTAEDEISKFIQLVSGIYCQAFNRRHARKGHVVTGRFWSKVVDKPGQTLETVRYIVMNPVRAGVVGRPEQWRWGSYRATLGLDPAPAFLNASWPLRLFDDDPYTAARLFKAFVDATVEAERPSSGVRPRTS